MKFFSLFSISLLVYKKIFTATTIHPGIFHRWAPWADSVSLWMNTIVSRDEFKPITVVENLVVNYNA